MPTTCEQRGPQSLPEFQRVFPDEHACIDYMICKRWPNGFVCPRCGETEETAGPPYTFKNRPTVLRCRSCKENTRLTADTVMNRSKQPICTWFWGAFLVTGLTPGMSAVQFQKMLGIGRYETAFQMLHKLRAAMVRPGRSVIGQKFPVEVDETFVGGATQGEGRGKHHKTLVAGAVEVMPRKGVKWRGKDPNILGGSLPKHKGGHGRGIVAGRIRLQVVPDRKRETLEAFVVENVEEDATVQTDGWIGYTELEKLGYRHKALAVKGDHAKTGQHLPMIHIAFGNLDTWLLGTHHGVSPQHLQAYLNEFVFRFNRRFWPMAAFDSVLKIAAEVKGPTYEELYDGEWEHPGGPE